MGRGLEKASSFPAVSYDTFEEVSNNSQKFHMTLRGTQSGLPKRTLAIRMRMRVSVDLSAEGEAGWLIWWQTQKRPKAVTRVCTGCITSQHILPDKGGKLQSRHPIPPKLLPK